MLDEILVGLFALCVAALLTRAMRHFSVSKGMLDIPNERSSHTVPTPRGGGVAIVVAASVSLIVLFFQDKISLQLLLALTGGGIVVAVVGYLDDMRPMAARWRLLVHFAAALWALGWLGGVTELQFGGHVFDLGWIGTGLAVLAIVWSLNLFNFMDGIDGIAASEAVFVAFCGGGVCLMGGVSASLALAGMSVAAASAGFLVSNWPPAKIFMGDIGSSYLGYVIAVLALACARESPIGVFVWLILGAIFFVDATVTLLRRLLKGERLYQAHRSHAYQILARRWNSHRAVTLAVIFANLGVLLPMAGLAIRYPRHAWLITCLALAIVSAAVLLVDASRSDQDPGNKP